MSDVGNILFEQLWIFHSKHGNGSNYTSVNVDFVPCKTVLFPPQGFVGGGRKPFNSVENMGSKSQHKTVVNMRCLIIKTFALALIQILIVWLWRRSLEFFSSSSFHCWPLHKKLVRKELSSMDQLLFHPLAPISWFTEVAQISLQFLKQDISENVNTSASRLMLMTEAIWNQRQSRGGQWGRREPWEVRRTARWRQSVKDALPAIARCLRPGGLRQTETSGRRLRDSSCRIVQWVKTNGLLCSTASLKRRRSFISSRPSRDKSIHQVSRWGDGENVPVTHRMPRFVNQWWKTPRLCSHLYFAFSGLKRLMNWR